MERRRVILWSSLGRIGQLLLDVFGNLPQSRPVRFVAGSGISTSIERCSAHIGKLPDSYPELIVGCIGIDSAQHKLSIELIEGGGIRRIVRIGPGYALNGHHRYGNAERSGQSQENQEDSRGEPIGDRYGGRPHCLQIGG